MIKIEQLIPFMKDGWVAMDKNGDWNFFRKKPEKYTERWCGTIGVAGLKLTKALDIYRVKDWGKSLIEIKNGKGKKDE